MLIAILRKLLRALLRKGGVLGGLVVGAALLLYYLWKRKRGLLFLLLLLGALALWLRFDLPVPGQRGPLRVTVLNVGKGDAIVIETPAAPRRGVLVVDTGGDRGGRVVAQYLRGRGIRRIDALLLTHPHPDHVGGAVRLIEQFPVRVLLDNDVNASSSLVRRYREAAARRGVPYQKVRRPGGDGDRLSDLLGGGDLKVRVLSPPDGPLRGGVNDTSIVLRIDYGRTSLLLTGNAGARAEAGMIQSGQPLANATVLKVSHHGSDAATTPRFLRRVRPRLALISVSADNRGGYPSPRVLKRLRDAGATIHRTDQEGHITCVSDGRRVRVKTQRGD